MLLLGSCQREDPETIRPKGIIKVNIGLFISVNEVNSNLKSTLGTEEFKVSIFNVKGEEVLVFDRTSEMPAELELEIGDYYVTAHSNNNLPAAFENPYYYGESELFSISAGSSQSVSVNCELANTMVSIIYSESLRNSFVDFTTTVSSSAGSLTFTREESRAGYFQPFPLNISATLTWKKTDGSLASKTITGTIPSPQPKKHYEIHIDAAGAVGSALIEIGLDEAPDPVEIVEITDNNDTPVSGNLGNGDLLITEIMYDPASLTDAVGEWFEIYNNTGHSVDLQQLVIRKNDTESHVINRQVILASHGYGILARREEAVAGDKYVYNTDITLNNTGAVLSVCNYGTDGTDGSVICSVNYGGDGFPDATGASLCLDPGKLNITDVVLGSSWCVSTTAYNTGDLGTPGLVNDSCH
jgi:hypothetical protein